MRDEDLSCLQIRLLDEITAEATHTVAAMRVFQNNHLLGLIDVLACAYDMTFELLGQESFKAFARDYVRAYPLESGNRNDYGAHFAAILEGHEALESVPWMADFARFEWAAHRAHHADEACPCTPEDLMSPETMISLHPSVSLLEVSYAVTTLYFTLMFGMETSPPVRADKTLLIGRDQSDALFSLELTALIRRFIETLRAEHALAATLDQMEPTADEMAELQTFMGQCLRDGILVLKPATP